MAFELKFATYCCRCHYVINPGKMATMVDFAAKHIAHYPTCPTPLSICSKCNMELLPSGKCGNC